MMQSAASKIERLDRADLRPNTRLARKGPEPQVRFQPRLCMKKAAFRAANQDDTDMLNLLA